MPKLNFLLTELKDKYTPSPWSGDIQRENREEQKSLAGFSMTLLTILSKNALVKKNALGFGNVIVRGLKTVSLPDLPYGYGALEPVINGEIMFLHHQKHHQAYVTNFNSALGQLEDAMSRGDHSTILKLQSALKFNGGGISLLMKHRKLYC